MAVGTLCPFFEITPGRILKPYVYITQINSQIYLKAWNVYGPKGQVEDYIIVFQFVACLRYN